MLNWNYCPYICSCLTSRVPKLKNVRILQRFILTISFYLVSLGLFSQTNFSFNLEAGIGLNKRIEIVGNRVSKPHGTLGAFHATINRNSSKKILLEASLFTMFIRNEGEIGNVDFTIRKAKLGGDIVTGYNVFEKTQLLIGTSVSTVPELGEIDLHKPDNLKIDLLFKANQMISPKVSASLRVRCLLNNLGNDRLLEDPRSSITLGINYHLRKV